MSINIISQSSQFLFFNKSSLHQDDHHNIWNTQIMIESTDVNCQPSTYASDTCHYTLIRRYRENIDPSIPVMIYESFYLNMHHLVILYYKRTQAIDINLLCQDNNCTQAAYQPILYGFPLDDEKIHTLSKLKTTEKIDVHIFTLIRGPPSNLQTIRENTHYFILFFFILIV